jgi:hypothetical protein
MRRHLSLAATACVVTYGALSGQMSMMMAGMGRRRDQQASKLRLA